MHRPIWIFSLLIRLTLGFVFVQSGWGKIHDIDKVIGFFTELKIPAPVIHAYFVSWLELIGGTCILLGLFTRIMSIPLFIVMVVAIITTQVSHLESYSDILGVSEFLYALLFIGLCILGGDKGSIDNVIRRKYSEKKWVRYL